jgi:plasmid stabilization system protein ParE
MKFTVVWKPSAETKLAEIWTDATDQQAVTSAADSIDALLGASPLEVGESRVSNARILTVSPLSVYFDVYEDDCRVAVWAVWRIRG